MNKNLEKPKYISKNSNLLNKNRKIILINAFIPAICIQRFEVIYAMKHVQHDKSTQFKKSGYNHENTPTRKYSHLSPLRTEDNRLEFFK